MHSAAREPGLRSPSPSASFRLLPTCWLVFALVANMGNASPAHAEASPCRAGISGATAERLFAVLNQPLAEPDCKFEGVETKQSMLSARWSRGGMVLPTVQVVPRECASDAAASMGDFVVEVPPELEQSCPSVVPLIAAFVQQISKETPAGRLGSELDPLFRGARALFAALGLIAAGLLLRGASRLHLLDQRWVITGVATFTAALVVRAALPFSLGNWYSEVLPASGPPPWMRFGPGHFALQSLLRDAGVWNARTLILSQLLIGAAAVPLLLGVLWELRVGRAATAAALVLLVFAPFHARLSATTSEHLLASTLCLGLLLSWLRAARTGDIVWFALAALLFPAVCATRVDMAVQASLVLLWPLVPDRVEREGGGIRWPRWWMVAVLAVVAISTLVAAYQLIVLPSQHPTPDQAGFAYALRNFVPQFWLMATNDPAWVSLSSVLLAMVGALALAAQRPLLLLRVAGTLLVAFVVSGRSFVHDELVSARYFLFTIPIFLIASGCGFAAMLAVVPRRFRPVAVVAGIAGLALWTALTARSAYAARYAFQDEYSFARDALAQLPAGCAVYQVQIRADVLPRDVDCCLDVPRSPLVLDFPTLQLADLPDNPASILNDSRCIAYYEGVACEITPDPHDRAGGQLAAKAAAYFQRRCAEAQRVGRLELLAQTTTSPRTTEGFFGDERPHARLYRWTP